MPKHVKIATFNVENLFGRVKVFNFSDHGVGDDILENIDEFRGLIKKTTYSADDKKRMVEMISGDLKSYISVREDRGKLFKRSGWKITGVSAGGCDEWDGEIEFKRAKFSEAARDNTAKVINKVNADIACIVEVEGRPALRDFDAHLLAYRYKYEMAIDANDPRGIDVGLYSKFPFGSIRTHIFDKDGKSAIFSRDCLEVEIMMPDDRPLHMLCNHFKSRGYDYGGTADAKRRRQAERVAEILHTYDLSRDRVVVAGDLNDAPDSEPIRPLRDVADLYDVLELQYPDQPAKRWTYYYRDFEQIDYLMVSKPLKECFHTAGVNRKGMWNLRKRTGEAQGRVDEEIEYKTVTGPSNAASDHGAVWAEFAL